MDWILVALIIGAMVYSGMIVIEYTNYAIQVKPKILQLEQNAAEMLKNTEIVEAERHSIRDRMDGMRTAVSELSRRIADLRCEVHAEKTRKQRLEMEYFKQRLKGRLRPAVA